MKNASGKLLIIAILAAAVVAAGASWWFRYAATHRTLQFWGPETAQLIRDAPKVTLYQQPFVKLSDAGTNSSAAQALVEATAIDVSHARGLVHLRNALLEDRSFEWPPVAGISSNDDDINHWMLVFHDPTEKRSANISFTPDCELAGHWISDPGGETHQLDHISTKPVATGLAEFFQEASRQEPAAER